MNSHSLNNRTAVVTDDPGTFGATALIAMGRPDCFIGCILAVECGQPLV